MIISSTVRFRKYSSNPTFSPSTKLKQSLNRALTLSTAPLISLYEILALPNLFMM